ncbi:MAG: hypothetical protein AAF809_03805 [Bacteroidota bacterium]
MLLLVALASGAAVSAQDAWVAPDIPAKHAPRYEAWVPADGLLADVQVVPLAVDSTRAVRSVDPWLGRDKALHVGASLLLTLSGQYVLVNKLDASEGDAWPLSASGALAVGLLKEVADSRRARNPLFSWRDLAADAVGVGLGLAVIWL